MSKTQSDCSELPDENYFEQSKFNVMPVRNIYIHGHCHEKCGRIYEYPKLSYALKRKLRVHYMRFA